MNWRESGPGQWSCHPWRIVGSPYEGGYRYNLYHCGRLVRSESNAEDARLWAELCAEPA